MNWVKYDSDGRIEVSGEASSERVALMQGTPEVDLLLHNNGDVSGKTHWVNGGAIKSRPVTEQYADGPFPLTLDMRHLPEGSLVTVTNNAGYSVSTSDPSSPITLENKGTFMVEVTMPFPYCSFEQEVETHA